eukprot:403376914
MNKQSSHQKLLLKFDGPENESLDDGDQLEYIESNQSYQVRDDQEVNINIPYHHQTPHSNIENPYSPNRRYEKNEIEQSALVSIDDNEIFQDYDFDENVLSSLDSSKNHIRSIHQITRGKDGIRLPEQENDDNLYIETESQVPHPKNNNIQYERYTTNAAEKMVQKQQFERYQNHQETNNNQTILRLVAGQRRTVVSRLRFDFSLPNYQSSSTKDPSTALNSPRARFNSLQQYRYGDSEREESIPQSPIEIRIQDSSQNVTIVEEETDEDQENKNAEDVFDPYKEEDRNDPAVFKVIEDKILKSYNKIKLERQRSTLDIKRSKVLDLKSLRSKSQKKFRKTLSDWKSKLSSTFSTPFQSEKSSLPISDDKSDKSKTDNFEQNSNFDKLSSMSKDLKGMKFENISSNVSESIKNSTNELKNKVKDKIKNNELVKQFDDIGKTLKSINLNTFKNIGKSMYEWSRHFTVFGTRTGWHLPCRRVRQTDLGDLGVGFCVYFKMLKFFMILFLLFAILSLPAYLLFFSGNKTEGEEITIKFILSAFTLGNIGQSQQTCNYDTFGSNSETYIPLLCSYGTFEKIKNFGLAKSGTKCPQDENNNLDIDSDCSRNSLIKEQKDIVDERFEEECYGQKSCNFTIKSSDFQPQCKKKIELSHLVGNDAKIYIQVLCQQIYIKVPYLNFQISREHLGVVVVVMNIVIVVILLLSIVLLERFENQTDRDINATLKQTDDFSVLIDNLPHISQFKDIHDFKQQLWEHLENVMTHEPKLSYEIYKENDTKILNIQFAVSSHGQLRNLIKLYDLVKKQIEQQKDFELANGKKQRKELKKQIKSLDKKIESLVKIHRKAEQEQKIDKVHNAFVTLRSIRGRNRLFNTYQTNCIKRLFFTKVYKVKYHTRKLFKGNWLSLKDSVSPDIIAWENMNIGAAGKCIRQFLVIIKLIFLICSTFIVVIVGKYYQQQIDKYSPQVKCPSLDITKDMALEDQLKEASSRQGLMHCYCLSQYTKITFLVGSITFSDGNQYCGQWLFYYTLSNSLIYLVALQISVINIVINKIIRYVSQFEMNHIKSSQMVTSMQKMFMVSFFNTGVVIFIVNVNLELPRIPLFPFFTGDYKEFSVEWYRIVGSTISFTMLLNIITPHFANLMALIGTKMKKCRLQKLLTDKLSKIQVEKVSAEQKEIANSDGQFVIEFRYSQFLSTLFIIMMYSPGLPLLYVIAFFQLFVQYWFDKIFWLFMYSNSSILTPTAINSSFLDTFETGNQQLSPRRFASIHLILFICFFGVLLISYGCGQWILHRFKRLGYMWKNLNDKLLAREVFSDDILTELNFGQLINEYQKSKEDLKMLQAKENLNEAILTDPEQQILSENDNQLEKQVIQVILEQKLQTIASKLDEYFERDAFKKFKSIEHTIQVMKKRLPKMRLENNLRNAIYSYDLKDNPQYSGFIQLQENLKKRLETMDFDSPFGNIEELGPAGIEEQIILEMDNDDDIEIEQAQQFQVYQAHSQVDTSQIKEQRNAMNTKQTKSDHLDKKNEYQQKSESNLEH